MCGEIKMNSEEYFKENDFNVKKITLFGDIYEADKLKIKAYGDLRAKETAQKIFDKIGLYHKPWLPEHFDKKLQNIAKKYGVDK